MSERSEGRGSGHGAAPVAPVNVTVNLPSSAVPGSGGLANRGVAADPDQAPYSTGLSYGLWCAGLAGACGIHRFYMGKIGTGVLYLVTFGLLGIGQVVDLFRMKSLVKNANIRDGRIPHPRQAARLSDVDLKPGKPDAKRLPPMDLQQQLLHAALQNGGELTVTQGVMATGKGFEEVESTLTEMSHKGYVDVDNAPGSGVVVYRFPELEKRPQLKSV